MNFEVISAKDISVHHPLKTILGKKVLTSKGLVLGRVKDIAFDMRSVVGVYVSVAGITRYLVGMQYVEEFHADSVVLNIDPVTLIMGKLVFDKDGKKVGRVTKVLRAGTDNDFHEVFVKPGLFSKPIMVRKEDMEVIEKNIILKKIL